MLNHSDTVIFTRERSGNRSLNGRDAGIVTALIIRKIARMLTIYTIGSKSIKESICHSAVKNSCKISFQITISYRLSYFPVI